MMVPLNKFRIAFCYTESTGGVETREREMTSFADAGGRAVSASGRLDRNRRGGERP